jgi:hypothetical protein
MVLPRSSADGAEDGTGDGTADGEADCSGATAITVAAAKTLANKVKGILILPSPYRAYSATLVMASMALA